MKKAIVLFLTAMMCVCFYGCKSKEVQQAEELINAIGTVTLESGSAIEAAETACNALSAEDKTALEGADTLRSAREIYNALCVQDAIAGLSVTEVDVEAMNAAAEAYDALTDAEKALVTNTELLAQVQREVRKQSLKDQLMGRWYIETIQVDETGQIRDMPLRNTNHAYGICETYSYVHPEYGENKLNGWYIFIEEKDFYDEKEKVASRHIGTWDLSEDLTQLIIDPIVEGLTAEQLVFDIYEEDGFTKLRSAAYPYKGAFGFVREDQLAAAFDAKYVYVDDPEDAHQYLGDPISLGYLYDENGQRIDAYYENGKKLFNIQDAFLFPNKVYDEGLTLLECGGISYTFRVGSIPGRGTTDNVLNVTDLASAERKLTECYRLYFVRSDHVAKNYLDENGCRTLELTDGTVIKYENPEYIDLVNYIWKYLQADYEDYIY
ncbi:MAG: hypothetical protein ACI3V0_05840 [Faecousia sp.]